LTKLLREVLADKVEKAAGSSRLADEGEKKKHEELEAALEPLTKLLKEVLADKVERSS
jgi:hypothetical protein